MYRLFLMSGIYGSNYLSTLYFIFSIKGIDHGTTLVHCVDAVSCKCVLICKEKLTRMGK